MRRTIQFFLIACFVIAGLWAENTRAYACSYATPLYGFSNGWPDAEDTVPLDGSWATFGTYGESAELDAPAPVFVAVVKDANGNEVKGRTTFLPFGKRYENTGPDRGYTQRAFVAWTPDEPLTLDTSYTVTISRPGDDALQDYYVGRGAFKAVASLESGAPHAGLNLLKSQAEYVDTPAYDQECKERRPCTDGCGCRTYQWSTRYFRIPVIEIDFSQPKAVNNLQFYHVIEDARGKARKVLWSDDAKINTTFELEHGDEAPITLTFLTYALGHDQPVVRTEYTLTEEDLPPLESTEFIAEKAPKKCRNRSVTTVHTDGYKAPSQGCASATSHPMGIAWILFTFCLLLRLRLASNSDRVYAAKQCKN